MFVIDVEIPVTVMNDEQARLIMRAVETGQAETILKNAILFGETTPTARTPSTGVRREVDSTPLKMVETKSKGPAPKVEQVPEEKPERQRGIMGRKRFERRGG